MKTQIIQDNNGLPTGVFIPIEDWGNLKKHYPNIEKVDEELPQWQKDILDIRLADLDNPDKIEPIQELFKALDAKIKLNTIKLSDKYRGVFSIEDAKSFNCHTQQLRDEWDNT